MLVDVWILLGHEAMIYIKALKYLLILTLLFLANIGLSSVLPLLGGTRSVLPFLSSAESGGFGGTRDDIIALADNLSKQGIYDEAITEYKRFIFFNPDYADNSQVLYKMGLAYRAQRAMIGP